MKKSIIIIGLVLALLILFLNLPLFQVLSLSNRKNPSETIYSTQSIEKGFVIAYTHSVNKGRVKDYYRITEDRSLMLYKTLFSSYGAGIPEAAETSGAVFKVTADGYAIESLNRVLQQLVLAVGVVAEHSIIVGDHEFFLEDFFKARTSLTIEVKRFSLLKLMTAKHLEKTGKK